jgi:RHS repeat-associated protein
LITSLTRRLSRVYNPLGQLQSQSDAYSHATGFTYDANGNTDGVADALGRGTNNAYDPLNRLTKTIQDIGGIGATTQFQYDAQDNLTRVTDPKGLNTDYAYNGLGDLLQLTSPDTGTTAYAYDSAGNRASQTDARAKVQAYTYDALNRLTKITGPSRTYTYDSNNTTVCLTNERFAKGRLSGFTDASGNTKYCYNRFGDLVRKVQTTNNLTFTIRYGYDAAGRLASQTYPDGAVLDALRDGEGRITQLGITPVGGTRKLVLTGATYAPFGPSTGWQYGNGRNYLRTLNQNYQPQAIHDAAAGGLSLGFGYDAVGNLSLLQDAAQTTNRAQYGYDALNRLQQTKDGPTGTPIETYTYDTTGNRTALTNAGVTTAYTYPAGSHRLDKVGTVARAYDAAGNTVKIGGNAKQFTYDSTGRMTQVKTNGTLTRQYEYNAKGEQVRAYLDTNNAYFAYDEAGHLLGEYGNDGAPKQQLLWFGDLPVGVLQGAGAGQKLHYIEPDHLGTPRAIIDGTRNVAIWEWKLTGEAFGNTPPNQDPDQDGAAFKFDLRFPGQRYDSATGLNYNYFRDYDPSTGRYVESDPIGLKGGVSTYGYVGASPLMWKDTYGLVRWEGSAMPASTGIGPFAAGAYVFNLTSQCVKGRKAHVLVRAWGLGLGVGIKYLPITSSADNVTLEDHLPDIAPSNFNGLFGTLGFSVGVGGCTGYQIGSEWTPAVTKNPASCSWGVNGVDLGGGIQIGKSTLVGLKWEKCSDCGPVDTPFK